MPSPDDQSTTDRPGLSRRAALEKLALGGLAMGAALMIPRAPAPATPDPEPDPPPTAWGARFKEIPIEDRVVLLAGMAGSHAELRAGVAAIESLTPAELEQVLAGVRPVWREARARAARREAERQIA